MDFPEKQLYEALTSQLKDNEAHFNENGHTPPMHYDMDREQYLEPNADKEFPFVRPAIFFRFGEFDFVSGSGYNRKGTVQIDVVVVQDKYVDSAEGSENKEDFLKLLEYKHHVNTVLDFFSGNCVGSLNLVTMIPDHENKNLHVERIRYQCKFTLIKKSIG